MYGKKYHPWDEKVKAEGEEEKKYNPSQTAEGFLAIFGAVMVVAWVMSYLPKKGRSHGADSFLSLGV